MRFDILLILAAILPPIARCFPLNLHLARRQPTNSLALKAAATLAGVDSSELVINREVIVNRPSLPVSIPAASDSDLSPVQLSLEVASLRARLDRLERVSPDRPAPPPPGVVGSLLDSLNFAQITLNARTVEVCSSLGFFCLGSLAGASLLDRLWLLGGIVAAHWAAGAVYRDTRGGRIARKVGVQVAQFVRDVQVRYVIYFVFKLSIFIINFYRIFFRRSTVR